MDTDYIVDAIRFLRPKAEFSYFNDDYSTIQWDVLEGQAPTLSELEAAIEIVKTQKATEAQLKKQRAKLFFLKLGLTVEEIAVLLT